MKAKALTTMNEETVALVQPQRAVTTAYKSIEVVIPINIAERDPAFVKKING